PQAVGHVEGLDANLYLVPHADRELPRNSLIPLPECRAPQAADPHISVSAEVWQRVSVWIHPRHTGRGQAVLPAIRRLDVRKHLIRTLRDRLRSGGQESV